MPLLQPIEQELTATFMAHHLHTMFDILIQATNSQKQTHCEATVEMFKH